MSHKHTLYICIEYFTYEMISSYYTAFTLSMMVNIELFPIKQCSFSLDLSSTNTNFDKLIKLTY